MLARQYRLKRGRLFPVVLNKGTRLARTPYFIVLALPRLYASDTPTQYGFIVSKKVSNRANQRNKVKRRLRELVRHEVLQPQAGLFQPYIAVVIIALEASKGVSYQVLSEAFTKSLGQIAQVIPIPLTKGI